MRALLVVVCVVAVSASLARAQAPESYAPIIQDGITSCRAMATKMRQEAADCRRILAGDNARSCQVTEKTQDGGVLDYTPDQADTRAKVFDDHALRLQPHVAEVKRIEQQLASDKKAIKHLGFDRRAEEFAALEEIAKTQAEEYEKLKHRTLHKVFELALSTAAIKAGEAALPALARADATRMIEKLRGRLFFSPEIERSIRRIETARGAQLAKAWEEWIERAVKLNEAPELSDKESLEALVTVFSWGLKDPRLKLLIVELEWVMHATIQAVDGQINAADLERLTKLTDAQLKSLTGLTKLMARHVKALKAELTPLKGCGQI